MRYFYIDDSGTDQFTPNNKDNVYFSLCDTVMNTNELQATEELFTNFKNIYSERLKTKIDYLHDREIENGLLRGEGKYKLLKTDSNLKYDFLFDLKKLLREGSYRLISVVFNLVNYKVFIYESAKAYYSKRGERFSILNFDKHSMFMLSLVFQIFLIAKYAKADSEDEYEIYIERKYDLTDMDIKFLDAMAKKSIIGKKITIIPSIAKGSAEYKSGFEVSDLCANSLRKQFEDPLYRKNERELINDKIIENKELNLDDFRHAFGALQGTVN